MKARMCFVVVGGLWLAACGDPAAKSDDMTSDTEFDESAETTEVVVGDGEFGGYLGSDDYVGPELPLLAQRETADGVRFVLRSYPDYPMFDVQPYPSGWVPPGWCSPSGQYRLSMVFGEAVGLHSGPIYSEVHDGLSATRFGMGYADGAPVSGIVVQVDDETTSVSVTWSDGSSDSSEVTDGWAVLAVPGEVGDRYEVTLTSAGGDHTVNSDTASRFMGSIEWQRACTEPVAVLPEPGEQPDDPAAAERQLRERFDLLWNRDVPFADKGSDLLDDTTGVAVALERVNTGSYADAVKSAVHTLTDLVFVSPTEVWFTYDVETSMMNFVSRFGVARLVEGRWVFDRAVICQDVALALDGCVPAVEPLVPPR